MTMAIAIGQTVRTYAELTKPRLLPLVLVTGLPALAMAGGEWPAPHTMALVLLGIALAAAAANTFNAYIERDLDKEMERTKDRPLPAGRLAPGAALAFGFGLTGLSSVILYEFGGPMAAGLGIATILFYVFVYTIWLKPRTAWNAVIGGAAGAAAPLIADAAVNGSVGAPGLVLFAIVFFWQPPHVWAIALFRKDDYARAGFPVLPNVIGDHPTRWRMFWYTLGLVPVTLAPVALGLSGWLYLAVALVANVWFLSHAVRVLRRRTRAAARGMFLASLGYLLALFAAMIAELLIGLSPALA
jgi:protoheme IX farnesyltransferase